jgi:serine/threonine-protein kinase
MSVKRAVLIVSQLLEALEYAHASGFVHRDIKPANLMVTGLAESERVKVADFGLARLYQSSKLSGLTMTNHIGGTMQFMPPEQITNYRNVSPAADQYSSAATLYYLLTGQFIFDFRRGLGPNDLAKQFLKILHDPPVPIHKRRRDIPDQLDFILQRALAKEPQDRFPDVRELKRSLREYS